MRKDSKGEGDKNRKRNSWIFFLIKNIKQLYREMFSYLSETRCPVYPRAMNEQGMEEHCVSLVHDKVNLGNLLILIKQPMEKFVGFSLGKKEAELKSLS